MSVTRLHAEWLSLVDTSGPFLSLPVLLRVFPQGLDAHDPDHLARLRIAYEEWTEDPSLRRAWIDFVLRESLELPAEALAEGQAIAPGLSVRMMEHGETLRPDIVVQSPDTPDRVDQKARRERILIMILRPGQESDLVDASARWRASPETRMMELLRGTGVFLGLVTNGEKWTLVSAEPREATGFATWYASLWSDEPLTLRAFRCLLGARRLFGVDPDNTVEAMLRESRADQQQVTDQLGYQVRRAVELVIQAIDQVDKDHRDQQLLAGVPEKELYEAAVTVMMRLVFLFSAEEQGLLLLDDPVYSENYAVSTFREQLREAADQHGEEVLEYRHDAWARLLATFRAVHGGVEHDRMRLLAYGGHLFDPDRYPFLEGRAAGTRWRDTPAEALPIHNRTVLHLLEALQVLEVKVPGGGPAEARRLSFRALDIEQIGHVYEGLLDHTAVRSSEAVLGLKGSKDKEPEIPLSTLEQCAAKGEAELVKFLEEETDRSASALKRELAADRAIGGADSLDNARFLAACDNDKALYGRVHRYSALMRRDQAGYPVVIGKGSVYVTKGADRRSTGTHYTPRSLTEPIVEHALDPLVFDGPEAGEPRGRWKPKSAREILALHVCDMAMGSGAFLVQTCRYLSQRLVDAWTQAERDHPGKFVVTPEGDLSNGHATERLIPRDPDERLAVARRIVADRCLYGVDKNPMAVEMAKLSLWLITLQKGRPFTFLDHALRCGDSLLGLTDPRQIERFHTDVVDAGEIDHQRGFFTLEAISAPALRKAVELRRKLESFTVNDIRDAEEKERLLREAQAAVEDVRLMADLIVGAAVANAGQKTTRLLDERLHVVEQSLQIALDRSYSEEQRVGRIENLRKGASDALAGRHPFHWVLEFPEVLADVAGGRPSGFDAIVGNPPFQGGQKITGALGTDYRDFLVKHVAAGQRGSADLCAYFFLRAERLLRPGGVMALLATNTIAQGDTREVGLEQLAKDGCIIFRAVPSRKWPGDANLEVAHVWIRRGDWNAGHVLDDRPVAGITPFLVVPGAVQGKPYRLKENEGKSFQGSIVLGMGFVLTPAEAQELIAKDPRNKDVLFPYLNGEDLNSRPDQSPSRWVINFHDWPLEKAEEYRDCMRIVREKVKPERDRNNRKGRRERWWQFAERAPDLYATIAGMESVLALSLVNNHLGFASVGARQVFAHRLVVFPIAKAIFPILQSHLHYHWAWEYSSTMRKDINYSPSDCFETFPFPPAMPTLATIGETYHAHRQAIMTVRNEGLTKTYNRFHNSGDTSTDIAQLRMLHVEMDHAVAAAYGWTELSLGHGFHETTHGVRFTLPPPLRAEVLARLLRLNHARHAGERNS